MIPMLAAAGAATAEVGTVAAKAAVVTAKTAAETGAVTAKTGGQAATTMAQTATAAEKAVATSGVNAANAAQTLAPQATQGGNAASLEQAVMDLKTGKVLPDEMLKADSVMQKADFGARETVKAAPATEVGATNPIHYNLLTRNQALEGDVHPITGVPFEQKTVVDADGNRATGVFPKFESAFDAKLPGDMLKASDKEQFAECNHQLQEHIEKNPDATSSFSAEQLDQVRNGDTPDGYTWHHNEELGKMQLVKSDVHGLTGHTGGRSIWGGGSDFRV